MAVSTFLQSDFSTQAGQTYFPTIDSDVAVMSRIAAMFAPHQTSPVSMSITLDSGAVLIGAILTETAIQTSPTLSAPTSAPRVDRIVIDRTTGAVLVIVGTEASTPQPPALTSSVFPVARVRLDPGTMAVTNAMIFDERLTASGGAGSLLNIQRFTVSGTYTPTPGTTSIVIEVLGGGGSGGGCGATNASQAAAASGGGAGSYAKSRFTSGFSGGIAVTVGLGGASPTAGANAGNAGQASSFGTMTSCPGGLPGNAGVAWPSALIVGGAPTTALPTGASLMGCPGEGGGHGIYLNLNNVIGGTGGGSFFGGGGNAGGGGLGANAPAPGAGGGGSSSIPNSSARSGGAGGAGVAIVYEYS